MAIVSTNPATGAEIKQYPSMSDPEVTAAIEQADQAFQEWRRCSFADRAKFMQKAAQILRDKKSQYAQLMVAEMGKPIKQAEGEIEKCAWVCDFYAEQAETFLSPEMIKTDAAKSYVTFLPLGVVLAVMPWNFPYWQVFRFLAPALMAGNAGLLKHSSNVYGCALAIEDVIKEAGFPSGLFRTLSIGSSKVADVIAHPLVRAVTLTGSTPAGKAVAAKAGEYLKKSVLELGGSDPYVICEDADLASAAKMCVTSRLINGGQSCVAAKRFIVTEKVRAEFEKLFLAETQLKVMGDPTDPQTDIGPQARHDLRDELHEQVEQSIAKGAKLLLGGTVPDSPGAFYPATVLTDVKKGMPAYDDELFGPVAAIIPVKDEAEAMHVANDTIFGLGAAVFTQDQAKGERLAAQELDAGCCFVNSYVKSDPRLPFGGIKESGYGRELAAYGIREFVNIKTVYVQ